MSDKDTAEAIAILVKLWHKEKKREFIKRILTTPKRVWRSL